MKKLATIAALSIISATATAAQMNVGLSNIDGDFKETTESFMLEFDVVDNIYLELGFIPHEVNEVEQLSDKVRSDDKYSLAKFTLAPKYKYNINDSFAVFAKAGVAYSNNQVESVVTTKLDNGKEEKQSITHAEKNSFGLIYGIGAEYAITKSKNSAVKAVVSYDVIDSGSVVARGRELDVGTNGVLTFSLGLQF